MPQTEPHVMPKSLTYEITTNLSSIKYYNANFFNNGGHVASYKRIANISLYQLLENDGLINRKD